VMKQRGYSSPLTSGLYYMAEPYADAVNELMLMMNPSGMVSPESGINYFANFFNQMLSPGGRAPSYQNLMGNMLGAGGDPASALGAFLNVGDPQQQVRNFMSLQRAAGETGLHPYYADAANAQSSIAANAYLNAMSRGATPSGISNFVPYINEKFGNYAAF
jgi:hypothetical protein